MYETIDLLLETVNKMLIHLVEIAYFIKIYKFDNVKA